MKRILATTALALTLAQPALAEGCDIPGAEELKTMPHAWGPGEHEILALESDNCRRLLAGDIDGMIDAIIAEHGVILLDHGGLAVGREGQRAMFKQFLGAGYQIIWQPADAHVSPDGMMAWAIGAYQLTTPSGEVDVGKYTSVWEKIDGRWQNVVEMRNSNQ